MDLYTLFAFSDSVTSNVVSEISIKNRTLIMCFIHFSPASIQSRTFDFESGLKKKYCGVTITQQSAVVLKHFMAVSESLKLKSTFLNLLLLD